MSPKLLFIYYQNIKAGGVAKVLSNLVNELVNEGYEIDILFLMEKHDDFYPIDPRVKKHYVDSFDYWTWRLCAFNKKNLRFIPKITSLNNYIYQLGVTLLMNQWLKKHHQKYDTIISCWYKLSCTLAINRKVNHKTIAWEHISHTTGGFFWNKILKPFYRNLKAIVATNIPGEKYYQRINKNSFTIYNPMDNELENLDYISPENKQDIISVVARLDPEKNIGDFIDIIHRAQLPDNWKVKIIGTGSQENELKNLVIQKDISSKIEFLGSKTMEEVYDLLRISKINCLTSKVEALPTILIQAMFFSNVLIAYDCPFGPSDIINEENGFLIPLEDKRTFIQKIELLSHDKSILNDMIKHSFQSAKSWKKTDIIRNWKKILSGNNR